MLYNPNILINFIKLGKYGYFLIKFLNRKVYIIGLLHQTLHTLPMSFKLLIV